MSSIVFNAVWSLLGVRLKLKMLCGYGSSAAGMSIRSICGRSGL